MNRISFRDASKEDAAYVANRLRREDRNEVLALGIDPSVAVEHSRRISDIAYTGCVAGEPIMIFGAGQPALSDRGSIWALGTDVCSRYPIAMVKWGRIIVESFLSEYEILENYCDADYQKALNWLRVIGFEVAEPAPYGENNKLFCRVTIRR